jgi:hypothetical protein
MPSLCHGVTVFRQSGQRVSKFDLLLWIRLRNPWLTVHQSGGSRDSLDDLSICPDVL